MRKIFTRFFCLPTYSPFDWSVKMRFWRSPVIGHEQNLAKTFDSYLAVILNNHFATITDSLGISINDSVLLPTDGIIDAADKAVR